MTYLIIAFGLLARIANASTITSDGIYAATSQATVNFASSTFSGTPLMSIAYCESRWRQVNSDGSVLKGKVDNDDVGFMQINLRYHADKAKELGFDLNTPGGNILYARWLYDKEGTQPWSASKPCWQNYS